MTDTLSSTRRRLLATGVAGLAAGASGCLGSGSDGTDSGAPIAEHAAGNGLDGQPFRGPDPTEAPATLIAFEDPSCARCRAFERQVVPKLEGDVEAGRLSLVARN